MEQKLVFIDLDGTLTPQSTWYLLNTTIGITPEEDKALFERYLQEALSYERWNRELVKLYKSREAVSKDTLITMVNTIELRPDAQIMVRELKDKGYRVVVLSGSVDLIVQILAEKVGADEWRSTARLLFDEHNMLIDIVASGDEAPAKELLAEIYCKENGYVLADTFAVEDGGNGIELFKKTKGILLGSNESLKALAWRQVQSLSEIPSIL